MHESQIQCVKVFLKYTREDLHIIKNTLNNKSCDTSSMKIREQKPFIGVCDSKALLQYLIRLQKYFDAVDIIEG